ncbi:MAG: RIP metalloprotease RseP [Paracoccaceae bacterium]
MEFIASIPVLGGFLSVALPFVVVLGIVVFIHEYGHYIVGRWCGIHAETFSLGFGPVIRSWHDSRGTKWQLAALPLGGFVKFLGDADASSRTDPEAVAAMDEADRKRSFAGATLGRRALTVLAGPVANFVLSIAVFAGLAMWQGVPTDKPTVGTIKSLPFETGDLRPGDVILRVDGKEVASFAELYAAAATMQPPGPMRLTVERDGRRMDVTAPYLLPPFVEGVEPLSPASEAGIVPGDYILRAGGRELVSFNDLRDVVVESGGERITLHIWRGGEEFDIPIAPKLREIEDGKGGFEKRVMIGVSGAFAFDPATTTPAPWTAVYLGTLRVVQVITLSLNGLAHMIAGDLSPSNLQGPLGIAKISGATASQGFGTFLSLIAVISTAIGMLNLFPIPVLDGGHLVIFGFEAVRGKPPSEMAMRIAMTVGIALVLMLMVFATYNDIMRL